MMKTKEKIIVYGLGRVWENNKVFLTETYDVVGLSDKEIMEEKSCYVHPSKLNNDIKIIICIDNLYEEVVRDFELRRITNYVWIFDVLDKVAALNWISKGIEERPSDEYKHYLVREYAQKYNCDWLLETGTFMGGMIRAGISYFSGISSVELSEKYYKDAVHRFSGIKKIKLYQGDSSDVIQRMIEEVGKVHRIIFWLDGHYSGGETAMSIKETPIYEELHRISEVLSIEECCILIDDARCFDGKGDYPTISEVELLIKEIWKESVFSVKNDIIRITNC